MVLSYCFDEKTHEKRLKVAENGQIYYYRKVSQPADPRAYEGMQGFALDPFDWCRSKSRQLVTASRGSRRVVLGSVVDGTIWTTGGAVPLFRCWVLI